MDRRKFFKSTISALPLIHFRILNGYASMSGSQDAADKILSVNGIISKKEMGFTLVHEHLLVDFVGADQYDPGKWDKTDVENIMLPYLLEVKELGCRTFIDCTPDYLGRDPELLKKLSERSGMNIVIPTGFYGALKNKFLPPRAYTEDKEQLASYWTSEFNSGIANTGIRPGFIKIGVDNEVLSDIHRKLIGAAAIAHKNTGMTIVSHTGGAVPAFEQLSILCEQRVNPSAFVWVHAQAENDNAKKEEAARSGSWISLDGVNEENTGQYIKWLDFFKQRDLLNRVLISHDAGWYNPGQVKGGEIRRFTPIFKKLLPSMKKAGFTGNDIRQIFIKNPAEAFAIKKRMM